MFSTKLLPLIEPTYTYSEAVKVYVGVMKEPFLVHVSQIDHRSTFFAEEIRRARVEKSGSQIYLLCSSLRIFDYHLDIIYKDKATMDGNKQAQPTTKKPKDGFSRSTVEMYCRACIFTKHMVDCAAADLIIDALNVKSDTQSLDPFARPCGQREPRQRCPADRMVK